MGNKNIPSNMFDIKPSRKDGDLDWNKIREVADIDIGHEEMSINSPNSVREIKNNAIPRTHFRNTKARAIILGRAADAERTPVDLSFESEVRPVHQDNDQFAYKENQSLDTDEISSRIDYETERDREFEDGGSENSNFLSGLTFSPNLGLRFNFRKTALAFAGMSMVVLFIISGISFWNKGLGIKGDVLGESQEGYESLSRAINGVQDQEFKSSLLELDQAYNKFLGASESLDNIGKGLIEISRYVPFASKLSSGKNVIEAGKHISLAGKSLASAAETLSGISNPIAEENNSSFLELYHSVESDLRISRSELGKVEYTLSKVSIGDLPDDKQDEFLALKKKLPEANRMIDKFLDNGHIFVDLLGGNGPRKYLFLFQNNQELRATGGFIGSYGLLDIKNGEISNFFIDGIFNPDGQLKEKIVPPKPIQKISAAWSMHDSNWFPNFPTSAQKAIVFYEKTGGPTTDGIITFTPTVMQKLLEITGPIEMEQYDVTLTSQNFIEQTQYEVEVDYDEDENRPKKILADLAPIVMDRLFNAKDMKAISRAIRVFSQGLEEKHILIYSQNEELQKIISNQGWSGEVLNTAGDYLSVINTNINGFKTDGVIEEEISHLAEIQPDGSIIDTVTVTRHHNGGDTDFEWWNKVNANYMRVLVPKGSELLEASGQTREFNDPPLDYDALEFKRDIDVEEEENNIAVDETTGTRIYTQNNKTVFANWVYVSPKENVTIKYKYLLPFKVSSQDTDSADSFSLLVQKQSGSVSSKLQSKISYPKEWNVHWKYPEETQTSNGSIESSATLETDKFFGLVFVE